MKKSITLLFIFICSCQIILKAEEIPFEKGDLNAAMKKAIVSKKILFVECYTTWCGPCKWMAKNVFTDNDVAKFYESNFVNIRLDMEKGEGLDFAKRYEVKVYPTYVFLDGEGVMIHKACGSKEAKEFIKDGMNALDPKRNLSGMQKIFESGERSSTFLKDYLTVLSAANMNADKVVNVYIEVSDKKELLTEENFNLLASFAKPGDNTFAFIMSMKDNYAEVIGKEKINQFIEGNYLDVASMAGRKDAPDQLKNSFGELVQYKLENQDEIMAHMNWVYSQASKKHDNLYENAVKYIDGFKMDDANELNNAAWSFYESFGNDKEKMEKALTWIKKSVDLKKEYASMDTYANILYKMGKNEEAKDIAKDAIALGKENKEETGETENLLKQINGSKK